MTRKKNELAVLAGEMAATKRYDPANVERIEDIERRRAVARITRYVKEVVDDAPPLTQEQRVKIGNLRLAESPLPTAALPRKPAAGELPASGLVLEIGPPVSKQVPTVRHYTSAETAALGAAADRRAVEQQRLWDRRLKQISGSICDGC